MREWLRNLWTVFSGRRYQRRLSHEQVDELRRQEEIDFAREGLFHPRGGGGMSL